MSEHIFPTDGRSTVYVTKTDGISDCETALEEIIRCKDCRFSVKNATYCNISGIDWQDAEPNGFCAWAERRES